MHHGKVQNTAHLPGFLAMTLPEEAASARSRPVRFSPASPVVDLRALTQAVRNGDAAAFAQFYDLYSFRVYKYLLVISRGDEAAAREVFQTVAIKLAKKIEIFEEERQLIAWLQRVARNAFIDYCRVRQREHNLVSLDELTAGLTQMEQGNDRLSAALRQVLVECDPAERELLSAAYVDRQPLAELAAQTGQTYKALESRLGRLRQKLREKLLRHLRHED